MAFEQLHPEQERVLRKMIDYESDKVSQGESIPITIGISSRDYNKAEQQIVNELITVGMYEAQGVMLAAKPHKGQKGSLQS